MIGSMRSKGGNVLVWILMGLLVVGLLGFGIGGVGGGNIRSIGKVGEEPITVNNYAQAMRNEIRQVSQQFGQAVSFQQAQSFGLDRVVLQRLTQSAALDNETKRLGLSVDDEIVRRDLMATPAFQGLDGTFSRDSYDFALDRSGLSPAEFDEELRKSNARTLLTSGVSAGVQSNPTAAEVMLTFVRETRDIEWALLDDSQLVTPNRAPTDAEIQAHYDANPASYTAPQTRDITYVLLTPDMMLDSVDVSDEDLKKAFETSGNRFNRPEQRIVDRIVFGSDAEATEAKARLDAGTLTFDELIGERGLTAADATLGAVRKDGLATDAQDLVFGLEEPGVVGPAQSSLGAALYRVNAILEEQVTEFEDAREELRGELAGERARREVANQISAIDDLLAEGATLEDIAKETDMTLGQIAFTDNSDEDIAAYDEFRPAALAAKDGDFPEIIDLEDGGVFALRLNSIVEPALKPLVDVRDQVITDWSDAQTNRRLLEVAETITPTLASGVGFENFGLSSQTQDNVGRVGAVSSVPDEVAIAAFDLSEGGVGPVNTPDGLYILRVNAINAFDPEDIANEEEALQLRDQLDAQLEGDLLAAFARALQDEAGVQLNQAALNAVNTQLLSN